MLLVELQHGVVETDEGYADAPCMGAAGLRRDAHGLFRRIAIDAATDGGKRDAVQREFGGKGQGVAVAGGQ